ncbi:MAG: Holliday junction resolvase RuvX [Acidobacteria bacterium]|nr:Holliday junction resolvase RuvX [Acidobacteriota bacterium]
MQRKEITNSDAFTDISRAPESGRIVALDIGTRNVGVAVCDELQFTVRALRTIKRTNWKALLAETRKLLSEFDAGALVLGLPLNFDGSESEMSADARRLARNYSLSIEVPVFLQDERVSSIAARENLYERGLSLKEIFKKVDAEAAAIILSDFLDVKRNLTSSSAP